MIVDRAINLRNLLGVEPNGFRRFFVVEKDVEMFLEACELKGLRRYSFRRRWQGRFGSGSSIKTAIVKAWLTPKAV